jgi:hypothetical protein
VDEIFKSISSGFARFVFAWIPPALVSVGTFAVFLWPMIEETKAFKPVRQAAHGGTIDAVLVFAFIVLTFSILTAYSALPIYQVLEGYSLPSIAKKPLLRRQRREFVRIRAAERSYALTGRLPPGITTDDFRRFPMTMAYVRPTLLGNALTAMEHWGRDRYSLDSQTMWYELLGSSSNEVRQDVDEGRAPVDFFVSTIAHMCSLSVACIATAVFIPESRIRASVIILIAVAVIPISYHLAVRNVLDWSQSVKAMINVGRVNLAAALNLQLPRTLEDEREMWSAHYWAVELNQQDSLPRYNSFRQQPSAPHSAATAWSLREEAEEGR